MGKAFQVLLIQPRVEDFYATPCRTQPLGLGYLAAALMQLPGVDVQILDCLAGGKKRSIPWPKEFAHLKPYFGFPDKGPFSLFHQYYQFGITDNEILAWLKRKNPSLIGISALFTPYYRESLKLARLCKQVFPLVPVVMGGNHASVCPRSLFHPPNSLAGKTSLCDYIITGECEAGICGLVSYLRGEITLESVPNFLTRETCPKGISIGSQVLTKIRSTPHPVFPGLNPEDYTYNKQPMRSLLTSRGCRFRCAFCTVHHVFGKGVRRRAVDDVMDEILSSYQGGIRHFDFEDDDLTGDKNFALQLFDSIKQHKLRASFSAMNGIHYAGLDGGLCAAMKSVGFESVNLSLVGTGKHVHKSVDRPLYLDGFERSVAAANLRGLHVIAYIILGMPGQSLAEMVRAVRLLSGLQCLIGPSPYYCTPGTSLYEKARASGKCRFASEGFDALFSARLTGFDLECDEFKREDIYTLFRLCRLINFIKAGLDRGYGQKDGYFVPAIRALESGKWHAVTQNNRRRLPFSSGIYDMVKSAPLNITGYKTSRRFSIFD